LTPRTRRKKGSKPPTKSTISVRISPQTKRALDRACRENDRSLSAEAEARIEQTLRDQTQAILFSEDQYGRQLSAFLEVLGRAMRDAVRVASAMVEEPNPDWLNDGYLYDQAQQAAVAILRLARPEGDSAPKGDVPAALLAAAEISSDWRSPAKQRLQIGQEIAARLITALEDPKRGRGDTEAWAERKLERLGPNFLQRLKSR
jgi:hypothetical protein